MGCRIEQVLAAGTGGEAKRAAVKMVPDAHDSLRMHWVNREAEVLQLLSGKPYSIDFYDLLWSGEGPSTSSQSDLTAYLIMG